MKNHWKTFVRIRIQPVNIESSVNWKHLILDQLDAVDMLQIHKKVA